MLEIVHVEVSNYSPIRFAGPRADYASQIGPLVQQLAQWYIACVSGCKA